MTVYVMNIPFVNKKINLIYGLKVTSVGSRISPRWGRQLSGGGGRVAATYDFAKFSQNCMKLKVQNFTM